MNPRLPNAGDRLWSLIPRWTRAKDQLAGGVLEGLVRALGVGVEAVRDDVLRLRDDMFVDTCADELVPLIGDLVGESLDPRVPVDRQRYQVKRALHWRRRKGTPAQLEALAWILSGFRAQVLEPPLRDTLGEPPRSARVLGPAPGERHATTRRITGAPASDTLRIQLDVTWPVRRRTLVLEPVSPGGVDLHAIRRDQDLGLRRADGTAIFRGDDPRRVVGPGLDVEVVGLGGDLADLGRLTPRFVDLGGQAPPAIPARTLAIDPERGRVAGPSAVVGSIQHLRRYRLHFWEPLRAELVISRPHHLGDGVYTFSLDGADQWLTDEQAHRLHVHHADLCSESVRMGRNDERIILTRLGGGCATSEPGASPFVLLPPKTGYSEVESALSDGLPLDTAGLRRFFAIEDAWGWDLFSHIRLVTRFSREAPPDDTVEVDLRHGRFRIGPLHDPSALRVRYYRPYDVDEIRARVREELLHAVPLGRRAIVEFRDTAVPGYTARSMS